MISLLEENWLPVRRSSGQLDWIAPHQISEPDIVEFAPNRPDFKGALAQMMIFLLQTATPAETEGAWQALFDLPPTSTVLQNWFAPIAAAFVLDGAQARFMQDFSLNEGSESAIDALLIDAAGASTIDKNTDHFVKRGTINAMCPHCAATALFTLQTNAPAGGAGNRTSLRGGGPLTTLIVATPSISLWHDLWLNVIPTRIFLQLGGDAQKTEQYFTFPWLADMRKIQVVGGETQPIQVHPHHVGWAMPRRIRLDFFDVRTGECDVCKRESTQLLHRYITRPQGMNYKGVWRHPFSPYYETKEGWLPVHPQPGGFSYKNWLAWVSGSSHAKKNVQAAVIVNYVNEVGRCKSNRLRLWVFGFDLDNMKARCWYEATFPLHHLEKVDSSGRKNFHDIVKNLIEASEQSVFYLRQAVKQAWFGEGDVRGDLSFIDKVFWDGTESVFYEKIQELINQAQSETGIDLDNADFNVNFGESWLKSLRIKAEDIFNVDIVGAGSLSQKNPRRIAEAYNNMRKNFYGKAMRAILRLPVIDKKIKL